MSRNVRPRSRAPNALAAHRPKGIFARSHQSERGHVMALKRDSSGNLVPVAGNGLLHRRALLGGGAILAGAAAAGSAGAITAAGAEPLKDGPWSLEAGDVIPAYGVPSRFEKDVVRAVDNPDNVPRNSRARTPHHLLQGTITPNPLHFTICHGGIPDIDPAQHKLVIHGLVKQPPVFTPEALPPYAHPSRIGFVECG